MTVAVVILNWNGRDHLATYLPSVVAHSAGARLVVADNGSTDDSAAVVATFPAVEWLALPENYGFAEGYNRALARVDAEVYVLLNSDVRVTAGWLDAPLRRLRADPRAAAVQPKVLADRQPTHFEYAGAAGGYLDALGYPYCRGRVFDAVEADRGQYDDAARIDWATGACCFVRAAAYREVGGLDGSYFAHMEEIDLCWRLRRAGYTCWVEPDSAVYHLGGGTLQYASPRKTYLNFRNSLTTLLKNAPARQLLYALPARLLLDGVAALRFLASGQPRALWAVVRAHFAFYARVPAALRARRTSPRAIRPRRLGPSGSVVLDYYARGRETFAALASG